MLFLVEVNIDVANGQLTRASARTRIVFGCLHPQHHGPSLSRIAQDGARSGLTVRSRRPLVSRRRAEEAIELVETREIVHDVEASSQNNQPC